jgi:hypothetical protein
MVGGERKNFTLVFMDKDEYEDYQEDQESLERESW